MISRSFQAEEVPTSDTFVIERLLTNAHARALFLSCLARLQTLHRYAAILSQVSEELSEEEIHVKVIGDGTVSGRSHEEAA